MRKLVVSEFVALDGVIENPAWTMPFYSKEQELFKFAELKAADALLLGRVTYDGFAAAWPNMIEQTGEYGQRMNDYPKYVVSTTLTQADWHNSTIIAADVPNAIAALKAQEGRDLLVFGSGKLTETLLRHDLVDEYRLLIFPTIVGSGQQLFTAGLPATLQLVESQPFASGVVALTYRTIPKAAAAE